VTVSFQFTISPENDEQERSKLIDALKKQVLPKFSNPLGGSILPI